MQKTLGTRVARSVRNSSKSSQAWKSPADGTLEKESASKWDGCTLMSHDEERILVRRKDGIPCSVIKTPGTLKFFRDLGLKVF